MRSETGAHQVGLYRPGRENHYVENLPQPVQRKSISELHRTRAEPERTNVVRVIGKVGHYPFDQLAGATGYVFQARPDASREVTQIAP